ncbi:hypothetical protein ACIBH1_45250 [Nonomuraea sp. NPDC050663]|uniref:hypothetical protein n=1 Tax=Nonomuraea sp. NPDC050663 TaxID=3364370 RepID=UPI003799DDE7
MSDTLIVSPPRLPGYLAEIEVADWSLHLRRVDVSNLAAVLDNLDTGHPGGSILLDGDGDEELVLTVALRPGEAILRVERDGEWDPNHAVLDAAACENARTALRAAIAADRAASAGDPIPPGVQVALDAREVIMDTMRRELEEYRRGGHGD